MSGEKRIPKAKLFANLPDLWPDDPLPAIRSEIKNLNQKVVVLDDDPTGTQTVHDTTVLTEWTVEAMTGVLENPSPAVFVMHNSRSMTPPRARAVNLEIGRALALASRQTGRPCVVISRSDSTLRGHFPTEPDALAEALEVNFDGVLIVPAFMAGGRYTVDDVHYVAEGEWLIPAAQTPFASDAAFGYNVSNLREWVEEKTAGRISHQAVQSISLDDIRQGGPDRVQERLLALRGTTFCVINAVTERDLAVVALGALRAEAQGKRLLYRSAASFATMRAGIDLRPPLSRSQLGLPDAGGGLIVVGSYVPKTTAQLGILLAQENIHGLEVRVQQLLDDSGQSAAIHQAVTAANALLHDGETVVIYTSRDLVSGADSASSLAIGNRVSDSLVSIVSGITAPLRYLVAKGGITSSDVATRGLDVRRALVTGQILPGVPIWKLGSECRRPNLIYIVFPGNVGGDDALAQVVRKLDQGA